MEEPVAHHQFTYTYYRPTKLSLKCLCPLQFVVQSPVCAHLILLLKMEIAALVMPLEPLQPFNGKY